MISLNLFLAISTLCYSSTQTLISGFFPPKFCSVYFKILLIIYFTNSTMIFKNIFIAALISLNSLSSQILISLLITLSFTSISQSLLLDALNFPSNASRCFIWIHKWLEEPECLLECTWVGPHLQNCCSSPRKQRNHYRC